MPAAGYFVPQHDFLLFYRHEGSRWLRFPTDVHDVDFVIFEEPSHRVFKLLLAEALIVRFVSEQRGCVTCALAIGGVSPLRIEPFKQREKRFVGFYVRRHFVEASRSLNGDEKAVFPFDINLAAAHTVKAGAIIPH